MPIGERALLWVGRYLDEVRASPVAPPGHATLFVSEKGDAIQPARLTQLMGRYVERAGIGKSGACHVFRHTMATLMLEGGADVRFIQEILGHSELSTTEIYTRVNIKHLKAVHERTHPGANLPGRESSGHERDLAPAAEDVLATLEAEAVEEGREPPRRPKPRDRP